jgi:hypothetical protein
MSGVSTRIVVPRRLGGYDTVSIKPPEEPDNPALVVRPPAPGIERARLGRRAASLRGHLLARGGTAEGDMVSFTTRKPSPVEVMEAIPPGYDDEDYDEESYE